MRYDQKCIFIRTEVPVILFRLKKKLDHFRQILEKYSNTKIHKYSSSGTQAVPYGRTDGQTRRSRRFSQLCQCAFKKELKIMFVTS